MTGITSRGCFRQRAVFVELKQSNWTLAAPNPALVGETHTTWLPAEDERGSSEPLVVGTRASMDAPPRDVT